MKTLKIIAGLVWMMAITITTFGQEYDDMYFNKKDREKLKEQQLLTNAKIDNDYKAFKKKNFSDEEEDIINEDVNPTDSYSSRNVNPEYIARVNSEQASEDEQNYFVEGYNPAYSVAGTPVYNSSYYSNNLWNNPYYAGYYGSQFGRPYYNPYNNFNDPWRSSFYGYGSPYGYYSPYAWGNGWSSGWNLSLSYAWGNWCNPYNSYYYGYSPYYYGSVYYPRTVVATDYSRNTSYGKYSSRNGNISRYDPNARTNSQITTSGRDRNTSGRVSATNAGQEEYYNNRRSAALEYQRRFGSDQSSNSSFGRSSYERSNSGFRSNSFDSNRSSNFNNRSTYQPSRSSGSTSGGSSSTPSRSSSGSSTGRTRGGN